MNSIERELRDMFVKGMLEVRGQSLLNIEKSDIYKRLTLFYQSLKIDKSSLPVILTYINDGLLTLYKFGYDEEKINKMKELKNQISNYYR